MQEKVQNLTKFCVKYPILLQFMGNLACRTYANTAFACVLRL